MLVQAGYLDDDLGASEEDSSPRARLRIAVNAERCIGCYACRAACPESAIRVWDNLAHVTNPLACPPCSDAPCVGACPTDAIRDRGVRSLNL